MNSSLNGLMITGVILNIVFGFMAAAGYPDMPALAVVMAIFAIISIIGLIVSGISRGKVGPILVIVGSVVLVPLGLVAVFGARKALDALKQEEMEASNGAASSRSARRRATVRSPQ